MNAATPEASDDGALQVIFIQDPSSSPSAAQASESSVLASANALQVIPVPDALAEQAMSVPDISVDLASAVPSPAPDAALRSALYGRYVGQIDARIERAWRRPRTAIGAPLFACLVRIDQDSRGTVLEVTLEQCNGGERWQQSLVSAIESASPLPAPPDPKVFTRILHLTFQSQPYSPGAPQDGYEPPSSAPPFASATSSEDQNEHALAAFGRALRDPSRHKVISLTLTGDSSDRTPPASPLVPINSSPAASSMPTRPPAE